MNKRGCVCAVLGSATPSTSSRYPGLLLVLPYFASCKVSHIFVPCPQTYNGKSTTRMTAAALVARIYSGTCPEISLFFLSFRYVLLVISVQPLPGISAAFLESNPRLGLVYGQYRYPRGRPLHEFYRLRPPMQAVQFVLLLVKSLACFIAQSLP